MSAVSVWNDTAGVLTRGVPAPSVTPVPTGLRFQGDAGVGKIRLGATDGQNSLDSFDRLVFGSTPTRLHSTGRSYSNDSTNSGRAMFRMADNVFRQLQGWVNQGRMPMWSFRPGEGLVSTGTYKIFSVKRITDGSHNADLDYNFAQIDKLAGPVFGAFNHEPEDDFPVSPTGTADSAADYRAAYQYIIRRYNAGGHKNIVWVSPFFMAYTFKPASGRDFRNWHPNWDGTKWLDLVRVDGCDFYNPQAGVSAGDINDTWATQASRFINARSKVGAAALPWIIGEMGLMNQYPSLSSTGNTVPDFMADMVTTGGGKQGLVAVCLWNNDGFAFLPGTDPGAEKTNGWKAAVKLPNVVLA